MNNNYDYDCECGQVSDDFTFSGCRSHNYDGDRDYENNCGGGNNNGCDNDHGYEHNCGCEHNHECGEHRCAKVYNEPRKDDCDCERRNSHEDEGQNCGCCRRRIKICIPPFPFRCK